MRPTFAGFYTARSGIQAARAALDVTGNNMANLNTKGYTVQRLDTTSRGGADVGMRYSNPDGLNIGNGVNTNQVSQSRDVFLDRNYRKEIARLGEQAVSAEAKLDIDDIFNEITNETGLQSQINKLVTALDKLSQHKGDQEFDRNVMNVAQNIASTFRTWSSKLSEVRETELSYFQQEGVDEVNGLLRDIAVLNKEIKEADVSGTHALELQDQRNTKLDELSQYISIDVSYQKVQVGAGRSVDEMRIQLLGANGERFDLLDHDKHGSFELRTDMSGRPLEGPVQLELTNAYGDKTNNNADGSSTFDNSQIVGGQFNSYLQLLNDNGEYDVVNKADLLASLNAANGKTDTVNSLLKTIYQKNGSADAADVKARDEAVNELKNYLDIDVTTMAGDASSIEIRLKTENARLPLLTGGPAGTYSTIGITGGAGAASHSLSVTTMDNNDAAVGAAVNVNPNDLTNAGLKFDLVRLNTADAPGGAAGETPLTSHGIGYYQKRLDTLAVTFAETLNRINSTNEKTPGEDYNKPFFSNGPDSNSTHNLSAANINVAKLWSETQGTYVTTAKDGSNDNIYYMKKQLSDEMDFKTAEGKAIFTGTLQTYATDMSTQVGREQKDAADYQSTYAASLDVIERQRQSISSVGLDEESANLMMYNQSLTASSRVMTTLDEALDLIINGMGKVGR